MIHNLSESAVSELESRGFAEPLIREIDTAYPKTYYAVREGACGRRNISRADAEDLLGFEGFITGLALCAFEGYSNVLTKNRQGVVMFFLPKGD